MPGLYNNPIIFERTLASVTASTLAQKLVAPCDLDVIGLAAVVGTAPGASTMTVNVLNHPTSQAPTVADYNLWTATSVPSIVNAATSTFSVPTFTTVVNNKPYALNYPLPGPAGTAGYTTSQSTAQTTETPVTTPPTISEYTISALVAPDATYTDYNGVTGTSATWVHAGDLLSFVVGGTVGSAANLYISLFCQKH